MKAVTKEQFFAVICPLDVHPSIAPGPWPYTSIWKMRNNQRVVGKSVDHESAELTEYFLEEPRP